MGRRQLADFHQGLKACLHTTRRHHIILPFSITRDLSYPHAVQICLRTQWQRGSRGWFWGTLHILWTAVVLWILVEGVLLADVGSGFLLHWEDLDVSPVFWWLSWQAAGGHRGKSLSILNLFFILLLLSHSLAHKHTNSHKHALESLLLVFYFLPLSISFLVRLCDAKRLRIKWLSGRKFGSKYPSLPEVHNSADTAELEHIAESWTEVSCII